MYLECTDADLLVTARSKSCSMDHQRVPCLCYTTQDQGLQQCMRSTHFQCQSFFMLTHKVNLGNDLEIVLQQTPQKPAHMEEMPTLNSL